MDRIRPGDIVPAAWTLAIKFAGHDIKDGSLRLRAIALWPLWATILTLQPAFRHHEHGTVVAIEPTGIRARGPVLARCLLVLAALLTLSTASLLISPNAAQILLGTWFLLLVLGVILLGGAGFGRRGDGSAPRADFTLSCVASTTNGAGLPTIMSHLAATLPAGATVRFRAANHDLAAKYAAYGAQPARPGSRWMTASVGQTAGRDQTTLG